MSALGLLKAPYANDWTQEWMISNIFDVSLTQSARCNKMAYACSCKLNAFSCFMVSFIIWSFFPNAVKVNLKEP